MKRTTKESAGRMIKEQGTRKQKDQWREAKPSFRELDLSLDQERALFGLWSLQEKKGKCRFKVSASELYKAIGLKREADGDFNWYDKERMDKALQRLNETQVSVAYHILDENLEGKKVMAVYYRPCTQLVEIGFGKGDKDENGVLDFDAGEGRYHWVEIELKECLLNDIESYYRLLPTTLYEDIKEINKRRGMRTIVQEPRFIEWLFTQKDVTVTVNRYGLAKVLKMRKRVERRQWKELDQILARVYLLAQEMGYLEKVKMGISGKGGRKVRDQLHLRVRMFPNLR